jgi:hypothetical protein
MNIQHINAFLAISAFAFSAGAVAQNISESEYEAAGKSIVNEYYSDQLNCALFADSDKDICMAVAKGREKVARTKLEARYKLANKSECKFSVVGINKVYAAVV